MARIHVAAHRITIYCESPAEQLRCEKLPAMLPRYAEHKINRSFPYPKTLVMALRIKKVFASDKWTGPNAVQVEKWRDEYVTARALRDAEDPPLIPNEKISSAGETWAHQRRGFWWGFYCPHFMLSESVGFGKTKQFIDIVREKNFKRTLVLTKANAVDDWHPGGGELSHPEKHASTPLNILALGKRAGTCVAKSKIISAAFDTIKPEMPLIVVLSYETSIRSPLTEMLLKLPWDCVACDEIHSISSAGGRTSRFAYALSKQVDNRIGMTGSAWKHKPEDLYGQYRFIDPAVFGTRFEDFAEMYCVYNVESREERLTAHGIAVKNARASGIPIPGLPPDVPRFVVDYKNKDHLSRMFQSVAYHIEGRLKGLPEPQHYYRRTFLSNDEQKAYDQMEEEFRTELSDGKEIVAINAVSKIIRLQQLANGFITEPIIDPETGNVEFRQVHEIGTSKRELLAEVAEEIPMNEPLIVVSRSVQDMKNTAIVAQQLGRQFFEQSGSKKEFRTWREMSRGARDRVAAAPLLGAQIQSACEAIDLTVSAYAILNSVGWSLYQYEQFLGRIDRPGQTVAPTFIHLLAANTIEEKIYRALRSRRRVIDEILSAYGRGPIPILKLVA